MEYEETHINTLSAYCGDSLQGMRYFHGFNLIDKFIDLKFSVRYSHRRSDIPQGVPSISSISAESRRSKTLYESLSAVKMYRCHDYHHPAGAVGTTFTCWLMRTLDLLISQFRRRFLLLIKWRHSFDNTIIAPKREAPHFSFGEHQK